VAREPIRVVLLEDVPLFRQVIEQVLMDDEGITVCGTASTTHQALTTFPAAAPQVALLDLFLPDGFGFDVGVQLRKVLPDLHVIVLSEHARPKILAALPEAERRYWSYLLKTGVSSREALLEAIRACLTRPIVDERVREKPVTAAELRMEALSDRQREILALVASGMSNTAIAQKLFMSPKSVEYHLTQIYAQLQVNTDASVNARVQAAMIYADKERDD
jgi:DNA-binding NarL/FixJ family response regulator